MGARQKSPGSQKVQGRTYSPPGMKPREEQHYLAYTSCSLGQFTVAWSKRSNRIIELIQELILLVHPTRKLFNGMLRLVTQPIRISFFNYIYHNIGSSFVKITYPFVIESAK